MALRIGHEIKAVAWGLAALGHDTHELVSPTGFVLLGEPFQLGIDGLMQLTGQ